MSDAPAYVADREWEEERRAALAELRMLEAELKSQEAVAEALRMTQQAVSQALKYGPGCPTAWAVLRYRNISPMDLLGRFRRGDYYAAEHLRPPSPRPKKATGDEGDDHVRSSGETVPPEPDPATPPLRPSPRSAQRR